MSLPALQLRSTVIMASKFRTVFFLLPFLLFPTATAFNITSILGQFSDFSNLNNLLYRISINRHVKEKGEEREDQTPQLSKIRHSAGYRIIVQDTRWCKLASEINSRQTITILVANNAALSSVSNLPTDVLEKVLSFHAVLNYFDRDKITKLSNRSAILTTLLQASELATSQNGFLNMTNMGNGQIAPGSVAPGSNLTSQFC